MSVNISFDEIKKFWPSNAPDFKNINKYVEKYKDETIVIKYGGNVLIDRSIFNNFIEDIFPLYLYSITFFSFIANCRNFV